MTFHTRVERSFLGSFARLLMLSSLVIKSAFEPPVSVLTFIQSALQAPSYTTI